MLDTPQYILNKQRAIFAAKPEAERMQIGFDLIDFGWNLVTTDIRSKKLSITENEIKI